MFGKLLKGEEISPPPELPLVFWFPAIRDLQIHGYEPLQAWRFLSHHIHRFPRDLRAHTQRILLAQREPLQDRLAGSLRDLFIALGSTGYQLRQRILDRVKGDLAEEDQEFFQRWLDDEAEIIRNQQWYKGSLLGLGKINRQSKLIDVERSTENAQYSNIMEEVVACLEYGQIETAQALLEAEMVAGRADEAMEQELASIYQYTRNKEGLAAMVQHFQEMGRPVPDLWVHMQQESEKW